ncbi:alpha/beta hydrolase [Mycobacterium sp. 050128]|uniref:alpha/beta hydrolase n=1 Tax=Mycobacterium sp. 050128 TaxID=3096112 RepID=UPI002ED8E236
MSDVVLVHGSTQSAAGFWWLIEALARRGHRALTVQVPGAAAATSTDYAELLAAQLPADLHRPVIAAHSAAGLLVPALAERLDAAHLVWLAAAVADYAGGRSLLAEIHADPTAIFHEEWIGVDPSSDPVLATYFLFHDADLATLRQALPTVARCDLTAIYAETPPVDPAARPSTYLLPVSDRILTRAAMLHMARERLGVEPVEVPGGHNTHVAHPQEIAKVIDQATRQPAHATHPS